MEKKVKVIETRRAYEAPKTDFVVIENLGVLCCSEGERGMVTNPNGPVDLFIL